MGYTDLREWIKALENEGLLKKVKAKVDWNEEMGGIMRVSMALQGPALLFENIKDYDSSDAGGHKVFSGGLASCQRIKLLLNLPKKITIPDIVRYCKEKFNQRMAPITVNKGPVKENKIKGKDIDLEKFPIPKTHHLDGGRYIDTFCGVITKDPDTNWENVGLYRGMLIDKRRIGKLIAKTQHIGQVFAKYQERKQKMPIAIAYGYSDIMPTMACLPVPRGVSEWDIMGAFSGEPVQLVECETVPLRVPANAEIVVEGYVDPDPSTYVMEGPFGEYTGWYGGGASLKPVVEATCVTFRDDPILRVSIEGIRPGTPNEDYYITNTMLAGLLWYYLEECGVPGVTDVAISPYTAGTTVFVQIHKLYRGHAKQVANALWGCGPLLQWFAKTVMVVEEDIDIRDPDQLMWAFDYRVNADPSIYDLVVVPGCGGSLLDPSTRREERDATLYGTGKWARLLIDATRNWDYPRWEDWNNQVYPPLNKLAVDIEKKIKERWDEYEIGIPYLTEKQKELLTMEKLMKIIPSIGTR